MIRRLTIHELNVVRRRADFEFHLEIEKFILSESEVVIVQGSSGSGKTTVLDIVALIREPQICGLFSFCPEIDQDIDINLMWRSQNDTNLSRIRRKYFGYILQSGALVPFLNVRENIRLGARNWDDYNASSRIVELSQSLGIEDCLDSKPQYLSGGQRQRAAIARALFSEPKILVADEPTGSVDKTRARNIMEILAAISRNTGASVLIVTHDLELVQDFADRIYSFDIQNLNANTVLSRLLQH